MRHRQSGRRSARRVEVKLLHAVGLDGGFVGAQGARTPVEPIVYEVGRVIGSTPTGLAAGQGELRCRGVAQLDDEANRRDRAHPDERIDIERAGLKERVRIAADGIGANVEEFGQSRHFG